MSKPKKEIFDGYKFNFELKSGASLAIIIFDIFEHQWKYKYTFRKISGERERVDFVNNIDLTIGYQNGIAKNCNLSMEMVNVKNLGKKFLLGVDVSLGAKEFIQFIYEKDNKKDKKSFRLSRVEVGALKVLDIKAQKDDKSLIKQIEFPFPIKDVLELDFGSYSVPFLKIDGTEDNFVFPDDTKRRGLCF